MELTKKISKVINLIGWGITIILLLFWMATCEKTSSPKCIEVGSDTTYVTTVDTVFFTDTVYKVTTEYIPVPDTVYIDSEISSYEYKVHVEDSLISGDILSQIKTDGTLVHQELIYTPKFPKYINKTDSILITNYLSEEPKASLLAGVTIGLRDKLEITPSVGVLTKKKTYIGVGYNIGEQYFSTEIKFKIK